MIEVPATKVAKNFSEYRQAAQYEPVAVTHYNRVTEVLISKRDYDEFVRLKRRETRAFKLADLPGETLRAITRSRMDPKHDQLNELMDGD